MVPVPFGDSSVLMRSVNLHLLCLSFETSIWLLAGPTRYRCFRFPYRWKARAGGASAGSGFFNDFFFRLYCIHFPHFGPKKDIPVCEQKQQQKKTIQKNKRKRWDEMRRQHPSIEKPRKARTTESVWMNFNPCSIYTSGSHFKQSLVPYFLPVKVRINTALALHCFTTNHI